MNHYYRRSQSQANQQQRRQEGNQPAIKKPAQENITLSTLTKCQNLLEVIIIGNIGFLFECIEFIM